MTDQESRLECLVLALQTPGVADVLATAGEYYSFVAGQPSGAVIRPKLPKLAPRVVADDDDD